MSCKFKSTLAVSCPWFQFFYICVKWLSLCALEPLVFCCKLEVNAVESFADRALKWTQTVCSLEQKFCSEGVYLWCFSPCLMFLCVLQAVKREWQTQVCFKFCVCVQTKCDINPVTMMCVSALHKAGKHMENSIVASYVGLILGCLIQDSKVTFPCLFSPPTDFINTVDVWQPFRPQAFSFVLMGDLLHL